MRPGPDGRLVKLSELADARNSKRAADIKAEQGKNRLSESFRKRQNRSEEKQGVRWSEREDLNLRPLVSQTSALTGLRHAPMPFH